MLQQIVNIQQMTCCEREASEVPPVSMEVSMQVTSGELCSLPSHNFMCPVALSLYQSDFVMK